MKNPMFLLETVRAFMKSRILLTAAELDLFTQIDRGVDTYTFEEIRHGLEAAGFTTVRQIRHGEKMDCIVTARKETV